MLLHLLAQRPRLVTKDELIANFWKDTAVTDDVVVQCVTDIRKTLGDDPRKPRFIKTVPKAGYRFVAPVEEYGPSRAGSVEIEETQTVQVEYEEETARPARHYVLIGAMILLAAAAAALVARKFLVPTPATISVTLPQLAGKKPVAVMYLENRSGNAELDWMREGLADMLITGLTRSKNLTVLSREQLDLLLQEMGRPMGKRVALETAVKVARRTHASAVLLGGYASLGQKIRIDVQVHDASDGHLLAADSLTVDRPEQILAQVDLLSLKLAAALGGAGHGAESGLAEAMTNNLEAYRYYSLGVEKAQVYHNAEALALLAKATALDPQFAMAHARIGYTYAVSWDLPEQGRPHLEKAFRLSQRLTPKDRLYITGWYQIAHLDYPAAVRTFQQIVSEYPLEVEAYRRLGRLLLGEERYEEALAVLQQGLIIDSEARELHNVLGTAYSSLGRHEEAIAAQQRYVALAPAEPNTHDSLGLVYQWAGRYEEALRSYLRALELKPDFEIATIHLANTYVTLGRYRDALAQYRRYIQNAPSDVERRRGWSCVAWVYRKQGDLARANTAAKREENHGGFSSVLFFRALDRGDVEEARSWLGQFARRAHTNRGIRPPRRDLSYLRGYLAYKSGSASEAIDHFKEALRHPPALWNVESFESGLADCYLDLGRFDEAIAEYERILRINPNNALWHYRLGLAHQGKTDMARASNEWKRFLEIWKDADSDIPELSDAQHRLQGINLITRHSPTAPPPTK